MLPVTKYVPSGDQARSYISWFDADEVEERKMRVWFQYSLSSRSSSPKPRDVGFLSVGVHIMMFPSSPALASSSPVALSQYMTVLQSMMGAYLVGAILLHSPPVYVSIAWQDKSPGGRFHFAQLSISMLVSVYSRT